MVQLFLVPPRSYLPAGSSRPSCAPCRQRGPTPWEDLLSSGPCGYFRGQVLAQPAGLCYADLQPHSLAGLFVITLTCGSPALDCLYFSLCGFGIEVEKTGVMCEPLIPKQLQCSELYLLYSNCTPVQHMRVPHKCARLYISPSCFRVPNSCSLPLEVPGHLTHQAG